MDSDEVGLKFMYAILDVVLLNVAIAIVFSLSPVFTQLNLHDIGLLYLHGNISELIAYSLYSKRNYYFRDRFVNRIKYLSYRMIIFIIALLILAQIFLHKPTPYLFLLKYTALFYAIKLIAFYLIYEIYKYRRKKGLSVHRVLIFGLNRTGVILGDLIKNNPELGLNLIGFISEDHEYRKCERKSLGKFEDLERLTEEFNIDMIFVTLPKYYDTNLTRELLSICNRIGVRVRYVPVNQAWFKARVKNTESVGSFMMFNPQEIPLDRLTYRAGKRLFDIVFSLLVVILLFSWLFLLIALIIKLESKGPVFFIQRRTGINNKTFYCLKFRTMRTNQDADTRQATKDDDRITKVGKLLRKTNIDELPQFLNVLKGDMSVVGPRPHMLKHTKQYSALIEHYKVRHFVKPGITGWAQVNGYRGLTDELWKMEKRVQFDMEYLEGWTFIWDLRIIMSTLFSKSIYKNAG